MKISSVLECEVLVAGAGLAGLRAAKDLNDRGIDTILVSRGPLCSGSSFYPLTAALGSQNPSSEEDKKDYLAEVLETGCTVADEKMVRMIIDRIPEEIRRLPELSIQPERLEAGRPACFAKKKRILYTWGNWNKVRKGVTRSFAMLPELRVLPYTDLLYLHKEDGRIAGALVCGKDGSISCIKAKAVILATGGTCGLYKHSLNVDETVGTGHSLAMAAGASLINMEFLQFIPGFTKPVYKLLFSETTLRRAHSVRNADGEDALKAYLKAHGNGTTEGECLWDRALHGPFTTEDKSKYFELALMEDAGKHHRECGFEIRFEPGIASDPNGFIMKAREMYAPYDIDLSKDPIWLSSFAHCSNGGILINEKAETGVPGLYAAGEAAGGIHGADRHGGMATSAALVFGAVAAENAAAYVRTAGRPSSEMEAADALTAFIKIISNTTEISEDKCVNSSMKETVPPSTVMEELAGSLWYNANCLRNGQGLTEVLALIDRLSKQYRAVRAIEEGHGVKEAVKAFHALRTAKAMVTAMLLRKESRGPHYRSDCPEKDAAMDGKRILITEKGVEII